MAGNSKNQSSKRKKTTSSTSKKTQQTRKKNNSSSVEKVEIMSMKKDVILWSTLAVSILLFLSNLGLGGMVGAAVSGFFFGLFGLVAYTFPFFLLGGVFFLISNKGNKIALRKYISVVFLGICCCILLELIVHGSQTVGVIRGYLYGVEQKNGGGFVGALFAQLLCKAFGLIGAYVITFVLMIISFVLITEKSAVRKMQQQQELAKQKSNLRKKEKLQKEEMALQARQQRQEQRFRERQEQLEAYKKEMDLPRRKRKFKGVAYHTELEETVPGMKTSDLNDEMSEVSIRIFDDEMDVADCQRIPLTSNDNVKTSVISKEVATDSTPQYQSYENDLEQNQTVADVGTEILEEDKSLDSFKANEHTNVKPIKTEKVNQVTKENDTQKIEIKKENQSFQLPPIQLLKNYGKKNGKITKNTLKETADKLQQTLKNFGVNVTITDVSCGPAVTRYELQPEQGVKVSKIVNLSDDIKLNLAASDIRIEAPIPGKAAVGIEVPNKDKVMVSLRELIESEEFSKNPSKIAFGVGRDIAGQVILADIAKMPHLLIAGATGSGKSVCINTIIMSILYRSKPSEVKMIMIDPKVVELSIYNGIPHLLIPVVTDPKKAAGALHWAVTEMMERYQKFADAGVKDMKTYNNRIVNGKIKLTVGGETQEVAVEKMPQIVIVVDELADLMMVAAGEVEESICRLAQLARAAGIHLIIATQRPSVNVITGLIKANMPSRIAFSVTSSTDSRTILDMGGAEKLLGNGDMLYYPQGMNQPLRVQGCFVSEEEVQKVVDYLSKQVQEHIYDEEITEKIEQQQKSQAVEIGKDAGLDEGRDTYFQAAGKLIIEKEKGSIGMLQRNFKVGFNRAARIMDQLEEAGVVGPEEGTKPRRVLMTIEQFETLE